MIPAFYRLASLCVQCRYPIQIMSYTSAYSPLSRIGSFFFFKRAVVIDTPSLMYMFVDM